LFFRFIFLQRRHSNQNINSRQNKKILSNPVRFGKQIRRWLLAPLAARIPEYQNIIGFRHVLVHRYDSLDPMTIWNVVETKLESLAQKIKSLLKGYE